MGSDNARNTVNGQKMNVVIIKVYDSPHDKQQRRFKEHEQTRKICVNADKNTTRNFSIIFAKINLRTACLLQNEGR